ncbi:hypothetical protein HPP92_024018 [Vanilla planifolia]|uniref:Uncharacterized protein n=1 Tax=Vanilla planifolia TaxID=51239 RepID=A0A835PMZ8_VANPL|nr:hypothetical protein HPP92_024468 [Vanilla planifolia]KAG0456230.1 hypothetical protein HPP92_024018 [Vanilla planifolia]
MTSHSRVISVVTAILRMFGNGQMVLASRQPLLDEHSDHCNCSNLQPYRVSFSHSSVDEGSVGTLQTSKQAEVMHLLVPSTRGYTE